MQSNRISLISDHGSSLTCLEKGSDAACALTVIGHGADPHHVVPATTQFVQRTCCARRGAGHGPTILIDRCGTIRLSTEHRCPRYHGRCTHTAVICRN